MCYCFDLRTQNRDLPATAVEIQLDGFQNYAQFGSVFEK